MYMRSSRGSQPLLGTAGIAVLLAATFAYPFTNASAQVEKYTTFKNEKFGFRIVYPQSWEFSEVENGLFAGALTPRSTDGPGEVMMVVVMEVAFASDLTGKEIEGYLMKESDKILAKMGAIDADDGYQVVDKKVVDFAGTKAVRMKIEVTPDDTGQAAQSEQTQVKNVKAQSKDEKAPSKKETTQTQSALTAQMIITVKNGKAYGLMYMTEAGNFDPGLKNADRIINTFQFIESPKKMVSSLKITARMAERTNTLMLTLKNTKASEAVVYGFAVILPDDVKVMAIKTPKKWTKTIDGNTVTFATSDSPMLKSKSIKFSVVTDRPVEKVDWKALDVIGGQVDGGIAKVRLQK
jgi:hypothetical protein